MPAYWMTCTHCGERRNASGDYTSPANREKDNWDWEKRHAYGACLKNKENEVISTDTHIYNANRKIAAAEQDLKEAKELLKKAQEEERAEDTAKRIPVGTPVRNKRTRTVGQVKETGLRKVRVAFVGGGENGVWLKPDSLEILAPVVPIAPDRLKPGTRVIRVWTRGSALSERHGAIVYKMKNTNSYMVSFDDLGSFEVDEKNLVLEP